ncbi:hypothetical protein LSTR_LSTR014274 [Laodelphax striatellus]|uniref:Major facilitator superfamily (MFS) profile domain-containing protein n=1 Tax=Laodelphax striatellus TaxID=195883 RepID=A0A482WRQ7_LAOST|nr:hypothetical protein LSTR_LSTR014274 [Laodelphax striatellus]
MFLPKLLKNLLVSYRRNTQSKMDTEGVFRKRPKIQGGEEDEDAVPLVDVADGHDDKSAPSRSTGEGTCLEGDRLNLAILLGMYLLQGIPLGLSSAVPMLLLNKGSSYKQQAEFSLVYWPFSLKLLWAPLVDCLYCAKFGRRKTWLVPIQYLLGVFMMLLSHSVDAWITQLYITRLTALFFVLNFLAATQDIAVDGWALTMLKRCNVGYASTCNTVGQTAGYFFGYVLFIAFESAEFCNNYIRSTPQPYGIITFSGFLYFWGWIFIFSTTLIAIFKKELPPPSNGGAASNSKPGVRRTYVELWHLVVSKPAIRMFAIILLTAKISFGANDSVSGLKLIEYGIPKEKLAMLAVPLIPVQIVLPLLISKYTNGPRPMDVYLKAYPYRLLMNIVVGTFVWYTPVLIKWIPVHYYLLLVLMYSLHQIASNAMYVAGMAFFASVSDPLFGGTYMTLLNTLSNLGSSWPSTVALLAVDWLTSKQCSTQPANSCWEKDDEQACKSAMGTCVTTWDGYYVELAVSTVVGVAWYWWAQQRIRRLQSMDSAIWRHADSTTADNTRSGARR